MCRSLVKAWTGRATYDCDFNQMLALPAARRPPARPAGRPTTPSAMPSAWPITAMAARQDRASSGGALAGSIWPGAGHRGGPRCWRVALAAFRAGGAAQPGGPQVARPAALQSAAGDPSRWSRWGRLRRHLYCGGRRPSLPGATMLTLAGRCLFGDWARLVLVSVVQRSARCFAFLAALCAARCRAAPMASGWHRTMVWRVKGWVYLLSLRLVPVFPFFIQPRDGPDADFARLPFRRRRARQLAGTRCRECGHAAGEHQRPVDDALAHLLASFVLLGPVPLAAGR